MTDAASGSEYDLKARLEAEREEAVTDATNNAAEAFATWLKINIDWAKHIIVMDGSCDCAHDDEFGDEYCSTYQAQVDQNFFNQFGMSREAHLKWLREKHAQEEQERLEAAEREAVAARKERWKDFPPDDISKLLP